MSYQREQESEREKQRQVSRDVPERHAYLVFAAISL